MSIGTAPSQQPVITPFQQETKQDRLGWDVGQPALYESWGVASPYPKRALSTGNDGLPELSEEKAVARSMWRHPAFIVSIITTVLALIVGAVLMILGALSAGPPTVKNLSITAGEGNVHLVWEGPDTPFSLFVTQPGTKEVVDVSQLVRGKEAWIPRYVDLIDDNSCFIVRAASIESTTINTEAKTLDDQGAMTVCVNDAAK